jgi:hypothetical protein
MFMEPVTRLGAKRHVFGREVQVQPFPRGISLPARAYSSFEKMTMCHLLCDDADGENGRLRLRVHRDGMFS